MGTPEPEIGRGEGAELAGVLGLGQEADRPAGVVADGPADAVGGRRHGGRVLQLAFAAVQMLAVGGPQQPGRVQGIGQHRAKPRERAKR
ncbi:hypothetical protein QF032_007788 [Streptomyces achromogenes]|nr:hypothetical protein [Streptomyces achromogenes]